MQEITMHSLNTSLREINQNYPSLMQYWLKILLTITSALIGIVFMAVVMYLKKTGNCRLLEKHLNKKGKSKSIGQFPHDKGIELKQLNCSQKLTVSRPLSHTSTNNSLKSMAQRELPPAANYTPDFPRLTLTPILSNLGQRKVQTTYRRFKDENTCNP